MAASLVRLCRKHFLTGLNILCMNFLDHLPRPSRKGKYESWSEYVFARRTAGSDQRKSAQGCSLVLRGSSPSTNASPETQTNTCKSDYEFLSKYMREPTRQAVRYKFILLYDRPTSRVFEIGTMTHDLSIQAAVAQTERESPSDPRISAMHRTPVAARSTYSVFSSALCTENRATWLPARRLLSLPRVK